MTYTLSHDTGSRLLFLGHQPDAAAAAAAERLLLARRPDTAAAAGGTQHAAAVSAMCVASACADCMHTRVLNTISSSSCWAAGCDAPPDDAMLPGRRSMRLPLATHRLPVHSICKSNQPHLSNSCCWAEIRRAGASAAAAAGRLPPLPPKGCQCSPTALDAAKSRLTSAAAAAGRLFPARRPDAAAAAGQAQHAPAAAAARRAWRARPGEEALGRPARLLGAQARRQVLRNGLEECRYAAPVPRAGRKHLRARRRASCMKGCCTAVFGHVLCSLVTVRCVYTGSDMRRLSRCLLTWRASSC